MSQFIRRLDVRVYDSDLRFIRFILDRLEGCPEHKGFLDTDSAIRYVKELIGKHGYPFRILVRCGGIALPYTILVSRDGWCEQLLAGVPFVCGFEVKPPSSLAKLIHVLLGGDPDAPVEDERLIMLDRLAFSSPAMKCRLVEIYVEPHSVSVSLYVPNGCDS